MVISQHLKAAILSSRPPFLILTPVCVLLGLSVAMHLHVEIDFSLVWVVLIGALAAHICVNALNEYFDFKSGLDFKTSKTAFSGGSGALPNYPEAAGAVLILGIATLLLTIFIGLYLISVRGNLILPIGVLGVVIIVTYTQWINRSPLLCLIAPGAGFGLLMVVGSYVVLTGAYTPFVAHIGLIPFLLINNLLLLNQYPDMTADASIGRRTLPVHCGITVSNAIYAVFATLSYGLIALNIAFENLPVLSLIALIPAVFAGYALWGTMQYKANIGLYPKYLAANVIAAISTPFLLAISIIYG